MPFMGTKQIADIPQWCLKKTLESDRNHTIRWVSPLPSSGERIVRVDGKQFHTVDGQNAFLCNRLVW